jgi:hypothetical protein
MPCRTGRRQMTLAAASQLCRYCSSKRVRQIAWQDLMLGVKALDTMLMFDGARPIPKTLTFCDSCGEWLPASRERTQTEELIAAIRLVAAVPELANARLEHSDRPDIRVHLGGRIFGLEVTRIVRGGQDEIRRAQWRRGVERIARLKRRERSAPPVWVSLRWNPYPPRAAGQTVAGLLVDFVEKHLATLPVTQHVIRDIGPKEVPDELAPYVHGLHIVRTPEDDHWVSGFGNMPDVQPEELQQEIDGKTAKVASYTYHTDGLWLLIYAEASNAAQALV